jgi:hypothetical protein
LRWLERVEYPLASMMSVKRAVAIHKDEKEMQ